MNKHNK